MAKLYQAPADIHYDRELVKRLDTVGVETGTSSPEELGRFVKSESARFGKVIKSAGIKPI